MKIEIVPVEETKPPHVEEKAGVEIREPAIVVPESTITLEDIFAQVSSTRSRRWCSIL